MEKLQEELNRLIQSLPDAESFQDRLKTLVSVYPFNEYEYIISTLLTIDLLTYDEYIILRDEYTARNMFLYVFEISAPRNFGEAWAQGQLKGLAPDLTKPTKKLDASYSGQYDFLLDGSIRIEVKASRAVDFESHESLTNKALNSASSKPFDMNFQQMKPSCCDVFVWIGVWRDAIRYWVLASKEVLANKYYSVGQHRGNVGEGQLHLRHDNIESFKGYEVSSDQILKAIRRAYKRQSK